MKTRVDFCCFRINNVIRVFVVEYLRQVIIVKFLYEKLRQVKQDYQTIFVGLGEYL
jgi:hypothetical protein